MSKNEKHNAVTSFLWDIANLLWGALTKAEHQNVILPFTVLRRLDYALLPTKKAVLAAENKYKEKGLADRGDILRRTAGYAFYNTAPFTYDDLLGDADHLGRNLKRYIAGFSENVQDIFKKFRFDDVIRDLEEVGRLYQVMQRFNDKSKINLMPYHKDDNPSGLDNHDMGMVFEHLIQRYNEDNKERPGEHYTPRDIIALLVNLVISLDDQLANNPGISRTVADCCCGTGGMLSVCRDEILKRNASANVHLFGQEMNPRTWAVCRSDMLLTNPEKKDLDNIKLGSTLSNDQLSHLHFDYQFANPPYGFEWKPDKDAIETEAQRNFLGRFGAGLPRISDGQLLFLQHLIWHMNKDEPSFVGIVFNGSPLFTGDAGSGESQIRRWVLENDLLYALIGLPEQMFYNTGIQTYLWIIANQKPKKSRGKVMLLDASGPEFWSQMGKSIGAKRRVFGDEHLKAILKLFGSYKSGDHVRIFDSTEFGYRKIQVERPLRLNFINSPERIERISGQRPFAMLAESKKRDKKAREKEEAEGRAFQEKILGVVKKLPGTLVKDRVVYEARLEKALEAADTKLKKPVFDAILNALSERDETAEICRNKDGNPEPDPELRDHENVRLDENVFDYFEREVRPHVSDAWIDERYVDEQDGKVGKVGYEINFNRYFYEYKPPRDLNEIDEDIRAVEKNILRMLQEVMG